MSCKAFEVERSTYHYKSRRTDQAALEARIKEICQTRVRYGYRRIHVMLQRDGWKVNQKKVRRIYNELGLQLRNKTPKSRVKAKLRDDRREAVQPRSSALPKFDIVAWSKTKTVLRCFVRSQISI